MDSIVLLLSNLHCQSCVWHIQDILSHLQGIQSISEASLIVRTIRIVFDGKFVSDRTIIDALIDSAFEVRHVTRYRGHERLVEEHDLPEIEISATERELQKNKHIESCDACRKEMQNPDPSLHEASSSDLVTTLNRNPNIIDIREPSEDNKYIASISIEGMACASCTSAITAALESLQFTTTVSIDLLSNSGSVEFFERQNLDSILEQIEDIGYGATLTSLSEPSKESFAGQERVIEFAVKGLHCERCPERIANALNRTYGGDKYASRFEIKNEPTLRVPRLQIKYMPSLSEGLALRQFISVIKDIDQAFTVTVYHPPTIEERSRQIQRQEMRAILTRMAFAGLVAIPSLIIGVIYMSLVPEHNHIRMWFEEPLWFGNAMRIEWALFIMTTPLMFFGTDLFHRRAAKEIWFLWRPGSTVPFLRRFYRFGSMNLLISIGTLVAYISSLAVLAMNAAQKHRRQDSTRMSSTYFDVITFLTFFILIGRFLEAYSRAKAGDSVAMLANLRPREALLVGADQSVTKISVDQMEIGDTVRVPQGHSPPADGTVDQERSCSFDESSLTGESKPVRKSKGDTVYTGTINIADPIDIIVTGLGGTSMLDQIIKVIRGGQAHRAPIERLADVLTGYFVPVVTLLAIATWVIWLGLGISGRLSEAWLDVPQGGWPFWSLEFAIAVFVVACPCGIGLAAPTALFVGGGLAAKKGILVQGGGHAFQEASKLDAIVFDKTGTLTQGRMQVTNFDHFQEKIPKSEIFAMAAAMEGMSSHPIAQAISTYCKPNPERIAMADVQEIPGYGMTARFTLSTDGNDCTAEAAIGKVEILDYLNGKEGVGAEMGDGEPASTIALREALRPHQLLGHSVAIFAIRKSGSYEAAGIFALSDPLRPEAPEVITALRSFGISIHLCTGDNSTTAHAIASQLTIPTENVRAGVLPQGKSEYIHELQHPSGGKRKLVAFAGDGINDTPALTAADVSISLSSGSDIAMNASSFILVNSHLGAIHDLIRISRRVFLRVKLNFFWAAIYNLTLIPVAAGVFYWVGASESHAGWRMSPVWASVAMAGSSVSVLLSSLALKLPEVQLWSENKMSGKIW